MNNKGAIDLSVNMIVIIIISIVILVLGITLMYQLIEGSLDIKNTLDARTQSELERLLVDQGKKVALPLSTITLLRSESHVFGLGILNVDATNDQFLITVEVSQVFDQANANTDIKAQALAASDPLTWLLYRTEPITILENGHHTEGIYVSVPENALKGTYVFVVKVLGKDNEVYGNSQRFVVVVK